MEYSVLIGEIAKAHINYTEIAKALCITRDTLRYKLSGKRPFSIDEAFKIRNLFFPCSTIEELFSRERTKTS